MSKNHGTIYNVFGILLVIVFYLMVIEVLAIFFILYFTWHFLIAAAAYTNRKKSKASKGAFTTGIILGLTHSIMGKSHR